MGGHLAAPFATAERRRLLVIHNPTAGRRSLRRLHRFLAQLDRLGVAVVLRETVARGDAEAFARAADADEFDAIVAAGGDGTINEVVYGLAESALPLAVMPLGTANVLANEIGLPRDPERIAEIAVAGAARPIWVGEVAGRRFVMMAGIGFDAAVVAGLDLALKRRIGKLAFVKAIIAELLRHGLGRYRVSCEGADHLPASAVIANGRFYAGRFVLAPAARLDDPAMQLVLLMRTGRLAMIRYLLAMALGRVHRLRDVRILRTARLTVSGPVGAKVQADGDIVGTVPVTILVGARPLWLIQPAIAPGLSGAAVAPAQGAGDRPAHRIGLLGDRTA
jgi:diacylglycerol kinase (ATP)